jgi:hypothetical protein
MQLEIEHITVYDLAHNSFADGTFHAVRFEIVGIFKCKHQYLGQHTFSHSLRSIISPSPSMQLKFGSRYGV